MSKVWDITAWQADTWDWSAWANASVVATPAWLGEVDFLQKLGGGMYYRLFPVNTIVVTEDYSILMSDDMVVCDSSTAFTATLATGKIGKKINIKNRGLGNITVKSVGTATIDGETSQVIYQGDCMDVQYTQSNKWEIV